MNERINQFKELAERAKSANYPNEALEQITNTYKAALEMGELSPFYKVIYKMHRGNS